MDRSNPKNFLPVTELDKTIVKELSQFCLECTSNADQNEPEDKFICQTCEEKPEASSYCLDCSQYLCESCQRIHQKGKKTAKDQLISILEFKFMYNNSQNNENEKGKEVALCPQCHQTNCFHLEAFETATSKFRDTFQKLTEELIKMKDNRDTLERMESKMKDDAQVEREKIKLKFQKMRNLLEEKEAKILNHLDHEVEKKEMDIESQRIDLSYGIVFIEIFRLSVSKNLSEPQIDLISLLKAQQKTNSLLEYTNSWLKSLVLQKPTISFNFQLFDYFMASLDGFIEVKSITSILKNSHSQTSRKVTLTEVPYDDESDSVFDSSSEPEFLDSDSDFEGDHSVHEASSSSKTNEVNENTLMDSKSESVSELDTENELKNETLKDESRNTDSDSNTSSGSESESDSESDSDDSNSESEMEAELEFKSKNPSKDNGIVRGLISEAEIEVNIETKYEDETGNQMKESLQNFNSDSDSNSDTSTNSDSDSDSETETETEVENETEKLMDSEIEIIENETDASISEFDFETRDENDDDGIDNGIDKNESMESLPSSFQLDNLDEQEESLEFEFEFDFDIQSLDQELDQLSKSSNTIESERKESFEVVNQSDLEVK